MEQNKESGLIRFFRGDNFVFITFFTMIVPLMKHTAHLLLTVSSIKESWYSILYAFSFDLSIFFVAMHGKRSAAIGLAIVVFVVNICFFNLESLYHIFGNERLVRLVVTIVISGAAAWIIHSYANHFLEKIKRLSLVEEQNKEAIYKERQSKRLEAEIAKANKRSEEVQLMVEDLARRYSRSGMVPDLNSQGDVTFPFTCKGCGQTVLTEKSFDVMIRYCKQGVCMFKQHTVIPEAQLEA